MINAKLCIDNQDEAEFEDGSIYEITKSENGNNGCRFKILAPDPTYPHLYEVISLSEELVTDQWNFTMSPQVKYIGKDTIAYIDETSEDKADENAGKTYNPYNDTWNWF